MLDRSIKPTGMKCRNEIISPKTGKLKDDDFLDILKRTWINNSTQKKEGCLQFTKISLYNIQKETLFFHLLIITHTYLNGINARYKL